MPAGKTVDDDKAEVDEVERWAEELVAAEKGGNANDWSTRPNQYAPIEAASMNSEFNVEDDSDDGDDADADEDDEEVLPKEYGIE